MSVIQDRVTVSIETIMLATDFSPAAEKAALFAKALARRFASTVEIAHIFNPSTVDSYEESILSLPIEERRQNSQDRLEALENDFRDAGIRARSVSSGGHRPARDILELARKGGIKLLVTGTKSSTGMERVLLGSTAEAILRGATCPVLTVGPKAQAPSDHGITFRSILFATDFSAQAAKAAIFALSFAEDSGSHLYYCHVIPADPGSQGKRSLVDAMLKAALKKMIPDVSYEWCSPEAVIEHGDAAHGILTVAERIHADLIVLGPRIASFFLSHFELGLTHDLLARASCPVLTVC